VRDPSARRLLGGVRIDSGAGTGARFGEINSIPCKMPSTGWKFARHAIGIRRVGVAAVRNLLVDLEGVTVTLSSGHSSVSSSASLAAVERLDTWCDRRGDGASDRNPLVGDLNSSLMISCGAESALQETEKLPTNTESRVARILYRISGSG